MPLLPFVSALALFSAAITQQTVTVKPAVVPAPTTTFHSDAMHFDYTYESALVAMPTVADEAIKEEKDNATGLVKQAISCVSMPLTAADEKGGLRAVFIVSVNGACIGAPVTVTDLGTLTSNMFSKSMERFGTPQMGTASNYQVANHSAATLSGIVKSDKYGATFYGAASCVLQGTDAVCWEFMSSDCSALPGLMSSPVKFDGQPAEPLLPAKYSPACK